MKLTIFAALGAFLSFSQAYASTSYSQQIEDIAGRSACAKYSWKSRGHAPQGYMKGVALSFARGVCRLQASSGSVATPALLMSLANTRVTSRDAVAYYESLMDKLRFEIDRSGMETLRSVYTLGLGLGMRESSGKYCEGWDKSAGSSRPSSEAEAGIFQTSYNSMGASSELKMLYNEYRANPSSCMLDVFKEGVSCKSQSILGSGAGAEFQKFARSCPAFATEYAMVVLRVLRKHFGPINRKEAEVTVPCNQMLDDVQRLVEQDPRGACQELL